MKGIKKALMNIPKVLSIELTTRCNLNCVYCTKKSNQIGDLDFELDHLVQIQEQLQAFKKFIVCGIGESFCYPQIYEFVQMMADQKITIVTNGTVPIDYTRLNAKRNMEMLIFSIDALQEETLKKISCGYNFKNVIKNLENYQEYQRATGRKIQRVLNCTINEHNISEIMDLVEFARQYQFDTIHFSFPRGREEFIQEHQPELDQLLKQAWKKANSFGIFFVNPFETCCVYLNWVTPYLAINGDIFACAETLYIDDKVGNIFEQSFAEVWASPAYQKFQSGAACADCKFLSNCKTRTGGGQ